MVFRVIYQPQADLLIFSRLVTLVYPCPSRFFACIKNAPDLLTCFSKPCLPSTPMKIFGWWMHHKITICHELFLMFPFIEISAFIKNQSKQRMHQIFIWLLNYVYLSYFYADLQLMDASSDSYLLRFLMIRLMHEMIFRLVVCMIGNSVITLHTKPTIGRALVLI